MKSQLQFGLIAAAAAIGASADSANSFDWESITPKPDLEYHDCYGQFKCARLLLPLDWLDPSPKDTIALAIIKQDAVVTPDDPTYAGPVLSNPGGPGGSGVDFLRRKAPLQRYMVDTPGKKHFELVSFDPRGIKFSTPHVDCYPDNKLARLSAILTGRGSGGLNGGPASLSYGLGLFAIHADRCADSNGDFLQYVGTTSVARDMVAIIDKIDEYNKRNYNMMRDVEKEAPTEEGVQLELRRAKAEKDLPRLNYLGFSYGTVLGSYFASMFPGRVGRLVLDGVCDVNDYSNGDGWLTNTVDTDQCVKNFFQGCFDAGKDACPLYHDGDKSASDISTRVWDWIDSLSETPTLAVKGNESASLLSSDVQLILLNAMYRPLAEFKTTASGINDAMVGGNTTALFDFVSSQSGGELQDVCPIGNHQTDPDEYGSDSGAAVICGDGEDIVGRNMTFWRGYMGKQIAQSSLAGAYWSTIRASCANWKARAKWQFHGPFTTPEPSKDPSAPEPGRPAAPIFFLSNRFDPVTPLSAARRMAKGFPGASVLVQEAIGHCVMGAPAMTDCTRDNVRRYFDEGVVPKLETACAAACNPWGSKCEPNASIMGSMEDFPRDHRFPMHV